MRQIRWWSDVPACWKWRMPAGTELLAQEDETDEDVQYARWVRMAKWQRDRCAICGKKKNLLVKDHDHETGLMRGWLCYSCNTNEPSGAEIYQLYRWINPASICGVIYQYAQPERRLTPEQEEAEDEKARRALDISWASV